MIITIDGPAGAGKSTIARRLAERLGFSFLDTGAMYRAVTYAALREKVPWSDTRRLAELAAATPLSIDGSRICIGGEDVTEVIRSADVTNQVNHMADHPEVRRHLVARQRELVRDGNFITEGRDQGTDAFPHAEIKFYLTASAEVRARRRQKQLAEQGELVALDVLLEQQNRRDERDRSRPVGALKKPADAIVIKTGNLSLEQVLDRMTGVVRDRLAGREPPCP